MDDLGIPYSDCQKKDISAFEKRGVSPEIVELRYKHF